MIYEVKLPETPPSFNKVGHTGNRWAWTKMKKAWQEDIEWGLIACGVPRNREFAEVTAVLRFSTKRRRDAGNYRTLLEKVTGDALVSVGVIPDDVPDHFEFGKLIFDKETGPAETRLILEVK